VTTASPSPTPLDLDTLTLTAGKHDSPTDGACLMEAASWLAGEPWSDHPQCVSPVIGAFLRRWQDDLDDTTRQTLKRYIPAVLGTNTGPADEERRAWMVTDWMVRTYLPAWLRLGVGDQADAVAALAPLVDASSARAAEPALSAAYSAARSAAYSAARSAAYSALAPTVLSLQSSAKDLLDRLIEVGR